MQVQVSVQVLVQVLVQVSVQVSVQVPVQVPVTMPVSPKPKLAPGPGRVIAAVRVAVAHHGQGWQEYRRANSPTCSGARQVRCRSARRSSGQRCLNRSQVALRAAIAGPAQPAFRLPADCPEKGVTRFPNKPQ